MRSYCEELQRCRHDILLQYFDDGSRLNSLGGAQGRTPVSERERPKAGKKQSKAAAGGKSKRTDSNTLAAAFARSGAGPGARPATDTDGGKVSSYFTAARPLMSAQSGADAVLNSVRVSGGSAGAAPGTSTGTSGRAAMLSKASEDQRKAAARQASAMRKAVADLTAAAGLHDSQ
ncbi:hypothetical protein HaLaN_29476, partial [Haematococcus lacustris]